ncbi:MAG TPA: hypothetical protein VFQ59_02490 [Candidatus Paceibacterota bacterium]|nr:hypothetical protein [Candidatus Paceibacterota bacterium]
MFNKILSYKNKKIPELERLLRIKENGKSLVMCQGCYSFKYEGEWHIREPDFIRESDREEEITVRFSTCPDCLEEVLVKYEAAYF